MRLKIATGMFAVCMLGCPMAAWAADYSVAPQGNDSAAGSPSAPWGTIQHAVDAMEPGDSVTVGDGAYSGFWMHSRQGDAQHRFTIRAEHALGAKITGPSATASDPNDSIQLVSVSFATIEGFEVTGAARAGISIRTLGDETGADTTDNVVQNCRSHDNGGGVKAGRHDGIFTGFARNVVLQANEVDHNAEHGIYVSNSADNPVMRGNRSHDNGANGLQINGDASTGGDGVISNWLIEDNVVANNGGASAINLDGATFGMLRNNLVYGNANGGIALFMGDSAEASHDNVVVNNTVFDPTGARFAIQIDNGADNNIVFDNVFWSARVGMELGSVKGSMHDYNIVSSFSGGSAGAHESTPDPTLLFVDATRNDYHPGSALVGQGTGSFSGASVAALDFEGNARPQAGSYDIGCYQRALGGHAAPSPVAADAANVPVPGVADAGSSPSAEMTDAATIETGPSATVKAAGAMTGGTRDGGAGSAAGAMQPVPGALSNAAAGANGGGCSVSSAALASDRSGFRTTATGSACELSLAFLGLAALGRLLRRRMLIAAEDAEKRRR
jgi:parallel beta-helix repeat protein